MSTTGEAAIQSNFKFQAGDTSKFFALGATNIHHGDIIPCIYVTLQNLQLFTHGIMRPEKYEKQYEKQQVEKISQFSKVPTILDFT